MFKKIIGMILTVGIVSSMAVMPASAYSVLTGGVHGWSVSVACPDTSDATAIGAKVVTEETGMVKNGLGALKIEAPEGVGNYYVNVDQTLSGLEDGAAYSIKAWVYSSGSSSKMQFRIGDNLKQLIRDLPGFTVDTWSEVECIFTYASSWGSNFRIQVSGGTNYLYVDGLEFRKVTYAEDGTTVAGYGENMISNGGFETNARAAVDVTGWNKSIACTTNEHTPLVSLVTKDNENAAIASGINGSAALKLQAYSTGAHNAKAYSKFEYEQDAKYRLTGKVYASRNTGSFWINTKDTTGTRIDTFGTAGQWNDILLDFTPAGGNLYICANNDGYIYVDDLELRKITYEEDGTTVAALGENVLVNGDFETDVTMPVDTFASAAARDSKNYIALSKNESDTANIYQIAADGTEVKLELGDPVQTTTNNDNTYYVYEHASLTNGLTYNYKVKLANKLGMETEGISISAIPSEAYNNEVSDSGWSYSRSGDDYGNVSFEEGAGVDSSTAMKFTSFDNSWEPNNTDIINQSAVTLNKDTIYKLTFMAKIDSVNDLSGTFNVRIQNTYPSLDGVTFAEDRYNKTIDPVSGNASSDWKEYTAYFKGNDLSGRLVISIHRHAIMTMDNFALYEVDENLDTAAGAVNLFADANGDFESMDEPEFNAAFRFYAAYNDEENWGTNSGYEIGALTDLVDYETNVVYAEAAIKNEIYTEGKPYTFIIAVYKDKELYDIDIVQNTAAYLPGLSESETVGVACALPDMSDGDYEVQTFIWEGMNGLDTLVPLTSTVGYINESGTLQ